jgi:hypothetical protein
MKVSYEHVGFISEDELHIQKVSESNFIMLPPEFGMFYILKDATLKINIECKLCGTKRGMPEETTILVGNERILGTLKCEICNSHTLIIFRAETVTKMIKEMEIDQKLIMEHWGYVYNLYSN